MNSDRRGIELSGPENWRSKLLNGIFNLRVADKRNFFGTGIVRSSDKDNDNQKNDDNFQNGIQQGL